MAYSIILFTIPLLQDYDNIFQKSLAFNMLSTLMLVEVKLSGI